MLCKMHIIVMLLSSKKKAVYPALKLGVEKAVYPAIKLGVEKAVYPAIKLGVKKVD